MSKVPTFLHPDEFFAHWDEAKQEVLFTFANVIEELCPEATMKLRWNTVFYDYHGWMAYLSNKGAGVELVFVQSKQMEETMHLLNFANRKLMAGYYAASPKDIHIESIKLCVQEAMRINEAIAAHTATSSIKLGRKAK